MTLRLSVKFITYTVIIINVMALKVYYLSQIFPFLIVFLALFVFVFSCWLGDDIVCGFCDH